MQFLIAGGPMMWIILLLAVVDVIFLVKAAKGIFSNTETAGEQITRALNNALWMGILSAAVGVLGTVLGFSMAAEAISNAESVSPQIVWGGVNVALSTFIFGLFIFILTAIIVLLLKAKSSR